jgi:alpha-D-ribose 1-methylphosphonate 5-triphosphate synthase subunit PhnG
MTTRTTTIRVHDAQLRLLEVIANHDGVSVADVQRAAFSAYIDARAQSSDALLSARDEVAADWRDKDEARRREALQNALGQSVT